MQSSAYIQLLKNVLIDLHRIEGGEYKPLYQGPTLKKKILMVLDKMLRTKKLAICKIEETNIENRIYGRDWPTHAETMIGLKRLENIEFCVSEILKNNVPGDLIETGVWRGGATIFMRALLKDANVADRRVWVADSFQGFPKADTQQGNVDDIWHAIREIAIPIETVKHNFEKYNLLDDQVVFLKGWFQDTLPTAPIEKLALIRLDGDMYDSTMVALESLYPKLSEGGYVIIDDYGSLDPNKKATDDYREKNNIKSPLVRVDEYGVYWKK